MTDKATMWLEAFVDSGEWRWRFYTADVPSVVSIEYQEWNDATKKWEAKENANIAFSADEIEAVCTALRTVSAANKDII